MNHAKTYSLLLKHLDKPECFLEHELMQDYIENCQTQEPYPGKHSLSKSKANPEIRVSMLEGKFLAPVRHLSAIKRERLA